MEKSIIKFLDDRFGNFELLPYDTGCEYTFYLANGNFFNGVINKQLNIFYINSELHRMVKNMFGTDNINSSIFIHVCIKKWVEKTFDIKDCEIRQIRRNEL